jgi:hypothetical protein
LAQAGSTWRNRQLSFYYGAAPQSEVSVDLAIKKAVLNILTDDHATLPPEAWSDLAQSIDSGTVTSSAITKMDDVLVHEIVASDTLGEL